MDNKSEKDSLQGKFSGFSEKKTNPYRDKNRDFF